VDGSAEQRSSFGRDEVPAERTGAQPGSGALMVLVAGLFTGSALISVSLLWFAIKTIRWLLGV
jgi:hypothetical protein